MIFNDLPVVPARGGAEVALKIYIRPFSSKKDDFEALFKRTFKRKIKSAKIAKICWQITIAAWMQPLQYDLRDLAAKDNSIAQHQATFMQPLQCDLQRLSCKTQ